MLFSTVKDDHYTMRARLASNTKASYIHATHSKYNSDTSPVSGSHKFLVALYKLLTNGLKLLKENISLVYEYHEIEINSNALLNLKDVAFKSHCSFKKKVSFL